MVKEDKLDKLCDLFNQIVNQYGKLEKATHSFGLNIPLHLSDTHTIVAIGRHSNINIVNLSHLQGISRSAASQMVSKLVKRGFVKKEVSPKTNNEVFLTLTETGETVFRAHEEQHQWLQKKLAEIFEQYPEDTIDILMNIGMDIQNIWESLDDANILERGRAL